MKLGERKIVCGWTVQGYLPPNRMKEIADYLIRSIGMTPARAGRVDSYPYQGGGGSGYTLYQPLTESYLIADVYTDLNQTKLLIASCKPVQFETVSHLLELLIGPVLKHPPGFEL